MRTPPPWLVVIKVHAAWRAKAGPEPDGGRFDGYQGGQAGDGRSCASCARGIPYLLYIKVERFQDDMGGAVAMRGFMGRVPKE